MLPKKSYLWTFQALDECVDKKNRDLKFHMMNVDMSLNPIYFILN